MNSEQTFMDAVFLARLQFAVTIGFHYLFPPLSIGLALILVFMEGLYLKTGDALYLRMTKFWAKIFGLTFAVGVATGIVMEFEFGTNWSNYSRFVGDVFGSPLAAEGVFAFFLESSFLGLALFGWNRISKGFHFFATLMVMVGSHLSALWIIIANSWMQTPAGYHIVTEAGRTRAEITDFWAMVFNPSSIDRFFHTIVAAWQTGAWFVVGIAAWYLLKRRHEDFAKRTLRIGLTVALVASLLQLISGHSSANLVAEHQPAKLAAFEGHFEASAPATLYGFGWVDETNEKAYGLGIPGLLGFLVNWDFDTPIKGLRSFPRDEWPPVNVTFQTYHLMVAIGMTLIGLSVAGLFLHLRGLLPRFKWLLWILVFTPLLPQIGNQVGWATAEIGRQPWIVYGLMRTSEGISQVVNAGHIIFSLIMFTLIYVMLLSVFLFLLFKKIGAGLEAEPNPAAGGTE